MIRFRSPQTESKQSEAKNRIEELREMVDTPKVIGEPEDIVPFSWRFPLETQNIKKMSRVLKTMAQDEKMRALMPLNNNQ